MDNKQFAIMGLALSIALGPVGLIFSAIALNKLKTAGETEGKGFAIAGIVIGAVVLGIAVISIGCTACTVCALIRENL